MTVIISPNKSNTVLLNKGQYNSLMDTDTVINRHIEFFGHPPCDLQRNGGYIVISGITFHCKELFNPKEDS